MSIGYRDRLALRARPCEHRADLWRAARSDPAPGLPWETPGSLAHLAHRYGDRAVAIVCVVALLASWGLA